MTLNKRKVFLFDAVGATLSAFYTGIIIPIFSQSIGIPIWNLRALALYPLVCALFSFRSHFYRNTNKQLALGIIIIANLIYCVISGAYLILKSTINGWGQSLLLAEIVVIFCVVAIEINFYREGDSSKESPRKY